MRLRSVGIDTIMVLAQTGTNTPHVSEEQMWMTRARLTDVNALRMTAKASAPRGDVEMNVGMEACPNGDAYLWGAWVPREDYRRFITWEPPGPEGFGSTAGTRNFATFRNYLMRCRNAMYEQDRTFRAYCWVAEGEDYWLRQNATRFGDQEFMVPADSADLAVGGRAGSSSETVGPTKVTRVPTREEVNRFIASGDWVDMPKVARRQTLSTIGMGLKIVAPQLDFHWRGADVDGEASLDLYRIAMATDLDSVAERSFEKLTQAGARVMLLHYNGDDYRLVAHTRDWLDSQCAAVDLPHEDNLPVPQRVNHASTCHTGRI